MNTKAKFNDPQNLISEIIRRAEGKTNQYSTNLKRAKVSSSKMATAIPKSNSAIMAEIKESAKKFNRMVSGSQASTVKESSGIYDAQKAKEAREKKFSKDRDVETVSEWAKMKAAIRGNKTYGNAQKKVSSDYDPSKAKRLRKEQEEKKQSFGNGDGPGRSKVVAPGSQVEGYDPAKARRLREERKKKDEDNFGPATMRYWTVKGR